MLKKSTPSTSERGQSLVELAISIMFLLILLAGAVDLGRAFFTYIALRDAAQEGALFGSVNPGDLALIENRLRGSSDTPVDLSDATNIQVQITIVGPPCVGNTIRVVVSYPNFPLAMPLLGTIIGRQTIPITASVSDTILRPSCH